MKHRHAMRFAPGAALLGWGAIAEAQTTTAPAEGGSGGLVMAVVLVVALLVIVGVAVKIYDLKRKREAEAIHLQAQISDALLRQEDLFGLPITATANVPLWSGTPATVEITGQVPSPEAHERVLRVVREESSRIRADVEIEDRVAVVPTMAVRAA